MEWRDEGVLLALRPHGETSAILEVFTEHHGRHAGLVRGARSRKMAAVLQPGAQVDVQWRARLETHIGSFVIEPLRSRSAQAMESRLALSGLNAVVHLLAFALPERDAQGRLYHRTQQVLDLLGQDEIWPLAYLQWELLLLEELGYGLDLASCAATGQSEDLAYVSPKSGRAVSRGAAGIWADRLLPLPDVLRGKGAAPDTEVLEALSVTGYFLREKLARELGTRPLPEAREMFVTRFGAIVAR